MKVSVIGAGSWGTVVAALAAKNVDTVLWARRQELADEVNAAHTNLRYLPGFAFTKRLRATTELEDAVAGADAVVMGVPSHGFRAVLAEAAPHLTPGVPIVSLSKGVEQETLQRMTEVVGDVARGHPAGVLTGPNLAKEVMAGYPAASVIAFEDERVAEELQPVFRASSFRVYTNDDVVGCEIGGALKNVIAIAVGMADGMGFGDNTKAALITRGLAELSRLGVALGGRSLTFSGLTGMGDLVATCASPQSRNRRVGEELGRGRTLEQIVADMNMVAEGVKTSRAVVDLAAKVGVDMPIAQQVVDVLYGGKLASEVVAALMTRQAHSELNGIASRPTS